MLLDVKPVVYLCDIFDVVDREIARSVNILSTFILSINN